MAKAKKAKVTASNKTVALMKAKAAERKKLRGAKVAAPPPRILVKPKMAKQEAIKPPMRKLSYSKTDLEHFKKIILEKKKEILEELSTLRDSMMDSTTGEYASENSMYSTHMEQGTDAMEREKTFLFASREGKFLNHLEDALVRIEKGEYGQCTECGKLIEKERLEAVPHARQCLQCKIRLGK
ncbi:MAG TPA: TraR/DksA C4-type zinc finger protein [Bacteroidota bacterium]|jgi:RNA polymerase-binding protein DksA|nr:TraR/DksA C4-type zinc finger protein [Bacteroidota bacterium]